MKKTIFAIVLLSITISLSAGMKNSWTDFEIKESIIPDDYVAKKNMVLVAAKVNSNVDMKEYFIEKGFTSETAFKRSILNAFTFLFLDRTGKSKGIEMRPLFFSWDEYLIIEIPVGTYNLHSIWYPPNTRGTLYKFEINDLLNYNFTKETPFVYIGDITLLFDVENVFGIIEHRLIVEDNYLNAKEFLLDRIMDKNGDYLVPEKSLPENSKNLVFNIEKIN